MRRALFVLYAPARVVAHLCMPSSIYLAPPALAYARDPIWAGLTTDTLEVFYPYLLIHINDSTTTLAGYLRIEWPGHSLEFVPATADTQALQVPAKAAGESKAAYAVRLAAALRANEVINDHWIVTDDGPLGAVHNVRLTLRTPGDQLISATETINTLSVNAYNYSAVPVANLSALLEVYAWAGSNDPGMDTRLLKLHAVYSPEAQAVFDVSAAFAALQPHFPPISTVPPEDQFSTALQWGHADKAYTRYYLRHADKYGLPPAAERLASSTMHTALYGSRSAWAGSATVSRLAHNYKRANGTTFIKPITPSGIDYVYYMPLAAMPAAYVRVRVYLSDGTTDLYDPFPGTISLDADRLYYFGSGPDQLKLSQYAEEAGLLVIGYDFLIGPLDDDNNYPVTVQYQYTDAPTWLATDLLFDNGVGGVQGVQLLGHARRDLSVSGAWVQQYPSPTDEVPMPGITAYMLEQYPVWEVNSGYYPDWYIKHLQALASSGNALLVQRGNSPRLLPVLIEPSSVESVHDTASDLHAVTFRIRGAFVDKTFNL